VLEREWSEGQQILAAVCEHRGSSTVQILDTSDLEIPELAPRAATRSSTLRVDTPGT
jgi:hypothetical protein